MPVVFDNPGEVDILALTTMGVNVKPSSAIGIFGTGFKFGVAVLLRNFQKVEVYSGLQRYEFTAREEIIRGEKFGVIYCNDLRTGFTTLMGKQWEPWQAYRELRCNAMDEGGDAHQVTDGDIVGEGEWAPAEGRTRVYVWGELIEKEHNDRYSHFIDKTLQPLFVLPGQVEVYRGKSDFIFYKGVRIGGVPDDRTSRYTYNILSWMYLTEDRTMAMPSQFKDAVIAAVVSGQNLGYTEDCLDNQAPDGSSHDDYESTLDYEDQIPSGGVVDVIRHIIAKGKGRLNNSFYGGYREYERQHLMMREVDLNSAERETLDKAIAHLKARLIPLPDTKIMVVGELGAGKEVATYKGFIAIIPELLDRPEELVKKIAEEAFSLHHDCQMPTNEIAVELLDRAIDWDGHWAERLKPVEEPPQSEAVEPDPEIEAPVHDQA